MYPADTTPKAVLYCWPTSVLSNVPHLCLVEKGFTDADYRIHYIDVTKGENFSPEFLSICNTGTIPTLVVPTSDGKQQRTFDDTPGICTYLETTPAYADSSISPPIPFITPQTARDRTVSDKIIGLVTHANVNPNFLTFSAVNRTELQEKAKGNIGSGVVAKGQALRRYIQEAADKCKSPKTGGRRIMENETVTWLQEKERSNQQLLDIYNGDAAEVKVREFYDLSRAAWTIHVPSTLSKVEASMVGPYALGDYLSLADCHVIAWLAHIVALCGGPAKPGGLSMIKDRLGLDRISPSLEAYWGHWVQRKSFRRVLSGLFP